MELQEFCYKPNSVFDGRNKSYGAYLIRKSYESRISLALFIVLLASFVCFVVPIIWQSMQPATNETIIEIPEIAPTMIDVELPKQKEMIQPEIKVPPPPEVATINLPPFEPTPKKDIPKNERPPDKDELEGKVISNENKQGKETSGSEIPPITPKKGTQVTGDGDTTPENEVRVFAQVDAQFPGGMAKFYKAVTDNIKYPAKARREGIQGKISVEFVVETDGSITEPKVIGKALGYGCEEEALRAFNTIMKEHKWIPAEQNGKKVRLRKTLPITFKLGL
jgi:periplasmic protein TonB